MLAPAVIEKSESVHLFINTVFIGHNCAKDDRLHHTRNDVTEF